VTSILADENIPRATVMLLRKAGMDVCSASEDMPGAKDTALLERARSEERLLLTFDRDFGELIFRRKHQPPPAVVYLRFVPATPEEPASVLQQLLHHAEIELEGRFTVVMRDQVRQRPLP
jgi:predicted nuclease of predicted toxin-antitoxin system